MAEEWDYTTDVLIVGSGGGLVAALVAADAGLAALVIEKQEGGGGSEGVVGGRRARRCAGRRGRGPGRARDREAGAGWWIDGDVGRRRVDPEQPGDPGARRGRLVRGRPALLRGGRGRRRPRVVARTAPSLPHRRPRDG